MISIFVLIVLAFAAIAATVRVVALDGYGRIPDRGAQAHLDRMSAAHHPRRDLGTS